MPRIQSTPVIINGKRIPGLRDLGAGLYQTQLDRLPFSGAFSANTPEEARRTHDAYVARTRALRERGDLRVITLLHAFVEGPGRDSTKRKYWSALGAGPNPNSHRRLVPQPAGFVAKFGERQLHTLTADEVADFIRNATSFRSGGPATAEHRKTVQSGISKLYEQANLGKRDAGPDFIKTITADDVVTHAVKHGKVVQGLKRRGKMRRKSAEELKAHKAGADEKCLTDEETVRFFEKVRDLHGPEFFLLLLVQYVFARRVGEVAALEKEDVSFDLMTVQFCGTVVQPFLGGHQVENPLKEDRATDDEGGKIVVKLIPPLLVQLLRDQLEGKHLQGRARRELVSSPYLFPGRVEPGEESRPLNRCGIVDKTTRTWPLVGITRLTGTHVLRHTRVTQGKKLVSGVNRLPFETDAFVAEIASHASHAVEEYIHEGAAILMEDCRHAQLLLRAILVPDDGEPNGSENVVYLDQTRTKKPYRAV